MLDKCKDKCKIVYCEFSLRVNAVTKQTEIRTLTTYHELTDD